MFVWSSKRPTIVKTVLIHIKSNIPKTKLILAGTSKFEKTQSNVSNNKVLNNLIHFSELLYFSRNLKKNIKFHVEPIYGENS